MASYLKLSALQMDNMPSQEDQSSEQGPSRLLEETSLHITQMLLLPQVTNGNSPSLLGSMLPCCDPLLLLFPATKDLPEDLEVTWGTRCLTVEPVGLGPGRRPGDLQLPPAPHPPAMSTDRCVSPFQQDPLLERLPTQSPILKGLPKRQ